jgi:transcriptional regulator with XRE-family HTH domain
MKTLEEEPSGFLARLFDKQTHVALRVASILKRRGWKRVQLAEAMGIQAQSLSRMLSTVGANLTLKTIAQMEAALGEDLLLTPQQFEHKVITDREYLEKLNTLAALKNGNKPVNAQISVFLPDKNKNKNMPYSNQSLEYSGKGGNVWKGRIPQRSNIVQ